MSDQLLTLLKNTKSTDSMKLRNGAAHEITAFKDQFLLSEEKRQSKGGLKI